MPSLVNPLIAQLRARREFLCLTRVQLCERTGYGLRALEGWEVGRRSPHLADLTTWAHALGLELTLSSLYLHPTGRRKSRGKERQTL